MKKIERVVLLYAFLFTTSICSVNCKKPNVSPFTPSSEEYGKTPETQITTTIFMDDIFPSTNGTLDCSDALNTAIANARKANQGTLKLLGNPKSMYLFKKTINLSNIDGLTLDFNFSTLLDDVQGYILENANRAAHTFQIYNSSNIRVERINILTLPTRANNTVGIPTCVFWIGGQYLGDELTENIEVANITAKEGLAGSMFIGAVGELRGLSVKNINLYGDYHYGINLEYGLSPADPDVAPTLANGLHPYNITVENFNGYDLKNCLGFLRTAATYNVIFKNCTGYNVKNFIYAYCGDRDINRVSQNVKFVNCKSKVDPSVLNTINYGISIIVPDRDGSTEERLPIWTNFNQFFTFEDCEIWNNDVAESACVRFFGTQGIASFKNCLFKRSYYGVRGGRGVTTNPSYVSNFSLVFENCIFTENHRDLYLHEINGCSVSNSKFVAQNPSSTLSQVHLGENASNTRFSGCFFEGQKNNLYITNVQSAKNTIINECEFRTNTPTSSSMHLAAMASGTGNTTTGLLIDTSSLSKKITGEPSTETRNADNISNTYDFSFLTNAVISSAAPERSVSRIINGEPGNSITITGTSSVANLTIVNNDIAVPEAERLFTKSGTNITLNGREHLGFIKTQNGWIQK